MALTRAQRKLLAVRRAQRRLQHRLDDIDWELDELSVEVRKLAELEAESNVTLELEEGDLDADLGLA